MLFHSEQDVHITDVAETNGGVTVSYYVSNPDGVVSREDLDAAVSSNVEAISSAVGAKAVSTHYNALPGPRLNIRKDVFS